MGARYLIDANAISDYMGGRVSTTALDFMDQLMDDGPAISVINRIELLGHNRPEQSQFALAVEACHVYDLTEAVILRRIALRRSRRIKLPDAIIAATALVHDLTLISHNLSDFESISGLKVLDLHSL